MSKVMLALGLLPLYAMAQVICSLGGNAGAYKPAGDQKPSPDTMQVANRVNAALRPICADHCPQLGVYRNATAANAMLVLDSGQAKIVYSPQFFGTVYGAYGDAGLGAVFAHELGHALDSTLGAAWVNEKWTPELRADAWAGCILGRMNLKDAELASTVAALSKYPSPAHPAWAQRAQVVRTGFMHCGGRAAKFDQKR